MEAPILNTLPVRTITNKKRRAILIVVNSLTSTCPWLSNGCDLRRKWYILNTCTHRRSWTGSLSDAFSIGLKAVILLLSLVILLKILRNGCGLGFMTLDRYVVCQRSFSRHYPCCISSFPIIPSLKRSFVVKLNIAQLTCMRVTLALEVRIIFTSLCTKN